MKFYNVCKGAFLIATIGTLGITFWRYAHGDSLINVFLSAFLDTLYFLTFIYFDLKSSKGA
jgi:hypothetical protein